MDLSEEEVSFFAALIQEVPKVKLFKSYFSLKNIQNEKKVSQEKILSKALKIYEKHFGGVPSKEWSEKYNKIKSKNVYTKGKITYGTSFRQSKQIIVVQGRADVVGCITI